MFQMLVYIVWSDNSVIPSIVARLEITCCSGQPTNSGVLEQCFVVRIGFLEDWIIV